MLAAQSAAATGAARSQLCTNPWPVERLTTMLTREWLTRKKAAMATTQTTARAGRKPPGSSWPPNISDRSSRSTRPAAQAAASATESTYWGTLNSRLTGWASNSSWLTAIPAPVAITSTGGSRKTTPSTITMSQTPTEKRWLRSGTLTTNRSARTSPATYSSGGRRSARVPPVSWRTAPGRYRATTTVAAATTARTNSQAARGSEFRTLWGSVPGSLTTSPPSAYDQVVDGPFRVRDQVVDSRPGLGRAGVAGTAVVRGYMAIPLPYAAALGVAGCA